MKARHYDADPYTRDRAPSVPTNDALPLPHTPPLFPSPCRATKQQWLTLTTIEHITLPPLPASPTREQRLRLTLLPLFYKKSSLLSFFFAFAHSAHAHRHTQTHIHKRAPATSPLYSFLSRFLRRRSLSTTPHPFFSLSLSLALGVIH